MRPGNLLILTALLFFSAGTDSQTDPDQEKVIAEIKKLGGEYSQREGSDRKLISVYLQGTKATDQDLTHFKGLSGLLVLFLGGTRVTDQGLIHLKGLSDLEILDLSKTDITG